MTQYDFTLFKMTPPTIDNERNNTLNENNNDDGLSTKQGNPAANFSPSTMKMMHLPSIDKFDPPNLAEKEERVKDFLRKEMKFLRKQEKMLDNMTLMDYAIGMVEDTDRPSLTSDEEEVSEVSKDNIESLRRQEKLTDNLTLLDYTMGLSMADLRGLSLASDEEISDDDEDDEKEDVDNEN